MTPPDDSEKSIVTRLRGSRRVAAIGLVVALIALGGIATAQVFTGGFVIEDFESGDLSQWTSADAMSITNESDRVYEGAYAAEIGQISDSNNNVDFGDDTYRRLSFFINNPVGSSDNANLQFGNSEVEDVIQLLISGDGSVKYSDSSGGNTDTGYDVVDGQYNQIAIADINYNSNTYDIVIRDASGVEIGRYENATFNDQTDSSVTSDIGNFGPFPNVRTNPFYIDYITSKTISDYRISGEVKDQNGNGIVDANITVRDSSGNIISNATTGTNGYYEVGVENGSYDITASKDGYFPETETVDVSGNNVQQNFQLRNFSSALSIDTRLFLEHGQSAPYAVMFESRSGNDTRLTREDVTDDATLTSNDTSVVTVNAFNREIVATSDISVNNRTYLEATYTDNGTTYTARRNVTVANLTVDNLEILPPVARFSAAISGGTNANPNDKTIQIIIIGTAAAAAASLIATSFAGVATLTGIMVMGWILGAVSDGTAIVTIFIALFVGLNVAGNVDYQVRRGK